MRWRLEFVKWAAIAVGFMLSVPRVTPAQGSAANGALPTCTGWIDCNNGRPNCFNPPTSTAFGMPVVIADFADGVSSDGRGEYPGEYLQIPSGKAWNAVQNAAALHLGPHDEQPRDTSSNPRTLTINLNHPVRGGGGVPLGVITDGDDNGFYTQIQRVGDTIPGFLDIPVGATVTAGMMTVLFHVNGRFHVLQMGPNAFGHCHIPATLVNGAGTSSGTIRRASARKWVMDLPAGSIGRLFDLSHTTAYAEDKGLYFVHLHWEVGADVPTGVLVGRITDAGDNRPLDQANLFVRMEGEVLVASAKTHPDGSYRLPGVPVGTFEVYVSKRGFTPTVAGKVTIRADQTDTLSAALKTTGGGGRE